MKLNKSTWTKAKLLDVVTKIEENDRENAHARFDRFLKVEHMDAESLHIKRFASQENGDEINPTFYKIFRKSQILFPTRNPHLRRTALAPFDGICGEKTLTLEANPALILPEFIPFLFHSESFYAHTTSSIIGSTNPHCRWRDVANYEFLLPPKEQQAEIAELLWAMDEVIEKDIKIGANLTSLYIAKIERELLQRTANKIALGELGSIVRGVGYKPQDLLNYYDTDSCVILRSNNISKSKINFKDIKIVPNNKVTKEQFLINDDFAICMSNGSKDLVGKAAKFIPNGKNVAVGSFCAVMRPNSMFSADLLEHLFVSESYRFAIKRILSGSTINNLKPSDIESLTLRLNENIQEVKQILISLGKLSEASKYTDNKVYVSKSLQKSLINQVF
jgi:type I restriction enzyme S subunit